MFTAAFKGCSWLEELEDVTGHSEVPSQVLDHNMVCTTKMHLITLAYSFVPSSCTKLTEITK